MEGFSLPEFLTHMLYCVAGCSGELKCLLQSDFFKKWSMASMEKVRNQPSSPITDALVKVWAMIHYVFAGEVEKAVPIAEEIKKVVDAKTCSLRRLVLVICSNDSFVS